MVNIDVYNQTIELRKVKNNEYISLTDLARIKNNKDPKGVINHWMSSKYTIEYLGLWEKLNNGNFLASNFINTFFESGKNSFIMSPTKWIETHNAIGIYVIPKKNGGTFAHKDIALEFAGWISVECRLYLVKEFLRLKAKESQQIEWEGKRLFTKLNYLIQTEAINEKLIVNNLTVDQINKIYASEADVLNVALFGLTASEYALKNPNKKGNIRDSASTIELAILSNLEFLNSKLIKKNYDQQTRLKILNNEANAEKILFKKNNVKKISKTSI